MNGLLVEATPVTLKQRVLEDAEYRRKIQIHKDSADLESKLLMAGVIKHVLGPDAIKVNKRDQVRFDLDGVAFSVNRQIYTTYNDETGEPEGERHTLYLTAGLICSTEGCQRVQAYPQVNDVRKLSDLSPLFENAENDRRLSNPQCGLGAKHGTETEQEQYLLDDDLSTLPF